MKIHFMNLLTMVLSNRNITLRTFVVRTKTTAKLGRYLLPEQETPVLLLFYQQKNIQCSHRHRHQPVSVLTFDRSRLHPCLSRALSQSLIPTLLASFTTSTILPNLRLPPGLVSSIRLKLSSSNFIYLFIYFGTLYSGQSSSFYRVLHVPFL